MSFGDDMLAKYLVLYLAQSIPLQFRQAAFSNETFVDLCTVRAAQVSLAPFLTPLEIDRRQIDLYFRTLQLAAHAPASGTLLSRVALHHVTAFLFADFGDASTVAEYAHAGDAEAPKHKLHLLRRLITATDDDVYAAVLSYHPSRTLEPAARLATMVAQPLDASALQVLKKRHPTLELQT